MAPQVGRKLAAVMDAVVLRRGEKRPAGAFITPKTRLPSPVVAEVARAAA
jgi:hypothetical protein